MPPSVPPKGIENKGSFFGPLLRGLALKEWHNWVTERKLEEFYSIFSGSWFFKRPKKKKMWFLWCLMTLLQYSSTQTPEKTLLRYSGCSFSQISPAWNTRQEESSAWFILSPWVPCLWDILKITLSLDRILDGHLGTIQWFYLHSSQLQFD